MAATKAGGIETVLSGMAEGIVFLRPGQPPMIGKLAFAAAAKAQSDQGRPQFEGSSEIQEIKVLGEWDPHVGKTNCPGYFFTGGAPSMTRAGQTLSILKKENGKWVLARCDHAVLRVKVWRVIP